MKNKLASLLLILSFAAVPAFAQLLREGEGFEWKGFYFNPEASAAGAYDDRVVMVSDTEAEGDYYSEVAAGLGVRNLPARYNFTASGRYGYRTYGEFSELDNDFYTLNAALGTSEGKFNWKFLTDYSKKLDYSTAYNANTGTGPDSILANEPNTRFLVTGSVSYEVPLSEKSSLVPEYSLTHYNQEFESSGGTAEWQIHRVAVPVKYAITDKTALLLGGAGSAQVNKEEAGRIATVYVGVESRATEKTTYGLNVGYSLVDYEISGEDQGLVSDARVVWRPTSKLNAYVFGGNRFQPGYGGGEARLVYRAGYGAGWTPADSWDFGAQVLHDYQQAIGQTNPDQYGGDVRHFLNARAGYKLTRWAELALTARYVIDQIEVNQTVVSARLDCRF